jgi:hypothetical protein
MHTVYYKWLYLHSVVDHQHLNYIEPSIQFTLEREMDGHLAFLDLDVHRTVEGKLETVVYRKPTNTDKYLSYDSYHQVSGHKRFVRCENFVSKI